MKISNPEQINRDSISNIIFDWGGVITDLDFEAIDRMFNELGLKNFKNYFSKSHQIGFLVDFELGKISPEELRNEMRKYLNNDASAAKIDAAWNAVIGETPYKRIELLKHLGEKYNLYLLSNTNKIHTDYFNQKSLKELNANYASLFKKVYYSFDVGLRKPDINFFKLVIADSNLIPEQTLFVDDTEIHVDAAASSGMKAFHLDSGLDIVELFKDW